MEALDTATRFRRSVALDAVVECGDVMTPLHEFDVVMEGSVAHARMRRGRLLPSPLAGLGEDDLCVA